MGGPGASFFFGGEGVLFFRLLKPIIFDQPNVDNGGVSRGRFGGSWGILGILGNSGVSVGSLVVCWILGDNGGSCNKNKFLFHLFFLVVVLLSTRMERVSIFRVRDFLTFMRFGPLLSNKHVGLFPLLWQRYFFVF